MGQTDYICGVYDLGWHAFAIMLIFAAKLVRPSAIHVIPRNNFLHFVQGMSKGSFFFWDLR